MKDNFSRICDIALDRETVPKKEFSFAGKAVSSVNEKKLKSELRVSITASNTVINLISWCENFVERHSFHIVSGYSFHILFAIRPKLCGNCAFPQNFNTRKLGEFTVFFAVYTTIVLSVFIL